MKAPNYVLYLIINYNCEETTNLEVSDLTEAIEIAKDRLSLIDIQYGAFQSYISIGKPYPEDVKLCAVPSVAIISQSSQITDQKRIDYILKEYFY